MEKELVDYEIIDENDNVIAIIHTDIYGSYDIEYTELGISNQAEHNIMVQGAICEVLVEMKRKGQIVHI